jgi:hypothetical protein
MHTIKAKEDLRWKLLGPQLLEGASPIYFEMAVIDNLGITEAEWNNLTVEQQAKQMVYREIKNKIEMVERFYTEDHYEKEKKSNN